MANTTHRLAVSHLCNGAREELEKIDRLLSDLERTASHENGDGSHEWNALVACSRRHDRWMNAIHAMLPIPTPPPTPDQA